MLINFKFSIGEKVKIIDIDWHGTVIALFHGRRGNEVFVRYFLNAKLEETYFFEEELDFIIKETIELQSSPQCIYPSQTHSNEDEPL